jgi:hypothetical protein
VSPKIYQQLRNGKRAIERRLDPRNSASWPVGWGPVFTASNIHYELAGRVRAIGCGGIGAIHLLAQQVGLVEAIDQDLHLLKVHLPYHESDHVLTIAYNVLAGGTCLEDMERLRTDEAYLDSLGATRIPDPTTAGDFCRRFVSEQQVMDLMESFNRVRRGVWKRQPAEFFELAIVDADGTIAPTSGQCKQGMDMAYNGQWGYHPLVVSLANTKEPLYLVNRPGNRPSHENAAEYLDRAITLTLESGFAGVLLRGDTDFSQTAHLDRWDAAGVLFLFGMNNTVAMRTRAAALPQEAWHRLERPPQYQAEGPQRRRPANVKERIVEERNYKNLVGKWEDVAEFAYRPVACKKAYRVVALRKRIEEKKGQMVMWEGYRYFFLITNLPQDYPATELVLLANDRCDQENLIEQLKNGVKAMKMPTGDLISNWAYMVMASLSWTLKAWAALCLPLSPAWKQQHESQKRAVLKMEFKSFIHSLIALPCQIVRTGRRIVYRLLSWNSWTGVLVRAAEAWHQPLRC